MYISMSIHFRFKQFLSRIVGKITSSNKQIIYEKSTSFAKLDISHCATFLRHPPLLCSSLFIGSLNVLLGNYSILEARIEVFNLLRWKLPVNCVDDSGTSYLCPYQRHVPLCKNRGVPTKKSRSASFTEDCKVDSSIASSTRSLWSSLKRENMVIHTYASS